MQFHNKGSEFIYLKGKISWVRYITPDPVYQKWSITLHPDDESLKIVQDLILDKGIKNKLKKDDDGHYFVNFSRPTERKIKGKTIGLPPPVVVDANNQPMENIAIGNESDGTVKIEVYNHPTPTGGRGWAARWVALRVDNLIPYNMQTDGTPEQQDMAGGLAEQPTPNF